MKRPESHAPPVAPPGHLALRKLLFVPVVLTAWLAPYPVRRLLARIVTHFVYALAPRLRARLQFNMRMVEPSLQGPALRRRVKAVLTHYGYYVLDFLALQRGRGKLRLRRDAGPAILERLQRERRGAILVTAHLGSWEIAAAALSRYDLDIAMVSRAEEIGYLQHLRSSIRARMKHREVILEEGPFSVIPLLQRLQQGGMVGMQMDRAGLGGTRSVPFLGGRLRMPRGPARLAVLSEAYVLPVFAVFNEEGTYDVLAEEPIDARGRDEDDVLRSLAEVLERYVRRYPDQWLMMQDPWDKESSPGRHSAPAKLAGGTEAACS